MEEFWAVDYANDSAVYDSGRNYACTSFFFFPFESEGSLPRADLKSGKTSRTYLTASF